MAFKVPTPIHGWRVFAGEVGVIVLGVLLALGAQELVTRWNDRQRADDAIAAIRKEVANHDFNAAEIEIAAPCISAQVDAIQKRLVAGDTTTLTRFTDRFRKFGFVLRLPTRIWEDTAWTSIRDTDVLRQLEPEFAGDVAEHYGEIDGLGEARDEAMKEVAALNALSLMMPRGEAERLSLIQSAERIRSYVDGLDTTAGQVRDRLAKVGLLESAAQLQRDLPVSGTIRFCRAHGYPLGKLRPVNPNSADI